MTLQKIASIGLLSLILLCSVTVQAQQINPTSAKTTPLESRYLARITLNTPAELKDALLRAQALASEQQPDKPIAFILHGQEIYSLLNENKAQYSQLFSLADDLSQKKIVNIQVCSSWLKWQRVHQGSLPHFVERVDYAPTEIDRLLQQEGYTYF